LLDGLFPDERRGDSEFAWQVGGERIEARGHLFTVSEMQGLISAAGLSIEERLAIDYLTGESSRVPWHGQLLYRLASAGSASECR
jgi:hypothetical protein